jgi:hypothetical protein
MSLLRSAVTAPTIRRHHLTSGRAATAASRKGHPHCGLSLEHRGSLFHHHALRFQCRSPPACAQSERTQANGRPGIETELCQFENGPERLPMTNQIKSPAFGFEFGNELSSVIQRYAARRCFSMISVSRCVAEAKGR